jgi:hypothetical protein
MSRKTRSQRQRQRQRAAGDTAAPPPTPATPPASASRRAAPKSAGDPLVLYRSLAVPGLAMRLVLVVGLVLYVAAQVVTLERPKAVDAASSLALAGMVGILLFLGSGFVRHQRALFRIRRDHPGAWPTSIRFALSTLPIPLGFGGRPADSRERTLRRLTLFLLLAFAVTALLSSSRH